MIIFMNSGGRGLGGVKKLGVFENPGALFSLIADGKGRSAIYDLFCLPEASHADLKRELLVRLANIDNADVNEWQSVRFVRLE